MLNLEQLNQTQIGQLGLTNLKKNNLETFQSEKKKANRKFYQLLLQRLGKEYNNYLS